MIKLDNVVFSYSGCAVLRGLSAEFEPGQLCAVVGPNGCGKTTLIRLMARLCRPEDGRLSLDGREYAEYGRKSFARMIALLPQQRPIPSITARDLVSHGRFPYLELSRRLSKEDKAAVERALEETGTAAFAERNLQELSGGERQKVYLAMLLAQDTPYILLDEPTTYLDISGQFAIMENLRRMSDGGKCVVAVLHDLSLALRYADRVLAMENGEIRAYARAEDIVESGVLDKIFGVECAAVSHMGQLEYIIRPAKNKL